eukprot:c10213_g1_i1.p1 GENE.c10213_g1_i1~~c10213_g1_i1.p1  ORF type:complete len:270 (+),score=58.93 c10213_g1_i1:234-1043(+)
MAMAPPLTSNTMASLFPMQTSQSFLPNPPKPSGLLPQSSVPPPLNFESPLELYRSNKEKGGWQKLGKEMGLPQPMSLPNEFGMFRSSQQQAAVEPTSNSNGSPKGFRNTSDQLWSNRTSVDFDQNRGPSEQNRKDAASMDNVIDISRRIEQTLGFLKAHLCSTPDAAKATLMHQILINRTAEVVNLVQLCASEPHSQDMLLRGCLTRNFYTLQQCSTTLSSLFDGFASNGYSSSFEGREGDQIASRARSLVAEIERWKDCISNLVVVAP